MKRRNKKKGSRIKEKIKLKKDRMMEIKKVVEKQETQDDEEKTAKSEKEAKRLVPQKFHQ